MPDTRAILRLVKLIIRGPERVQAEPPKGFLFVLNQGSFTIDRYIVDLDYLLVQPVGYSDVFEYKGPLSLASMPWNRYCEWHDGPLDEQDDPRKRLYCPVSVTGDYDYCSKHRRSERALYSLCLEYHTDKALEACREVDKAVKGEYAVYMVDYGGDKPKVGTTRSFRLLERIAEQPNIVATAILVTDSIYRARLAEISVAREGLASESHRYRWTAEQDLYFAALRLYESARKVSAKLGYQWDERLFTATPSQPQLRPRAVDIDELKPGQYDIVTSWGGFIVVRGARGLIAIRATALLHRDSMLVDLRKGFK